MFKAIMSIAVLLQFSILGAQTVTMTGSMEDYNNLVSLKLSKQSSDELVNGIDVFIKKVGSLQNSEVSSESVRTGATICSTKNFSKQTVNADGTIISVDMVRVLNQAPVCVLKQFKSVARISAYHLVEKKKIIGRGTKTVKEKININFNLDEDAKVVTVFDTEKVSSEDKVEQPYVTYCRNNSKNTSDFTYSSEEKELLRECYGL